MSFQLKDKKKIQTLRKSLQIISQQVPEIKIHFAKDHIRFFTELDSKQTACMFDLTASYFSKFIAPDQLNQNTQMIQVTVQRDTLLYSLNTIDDTELDFTVVLHDTEFGVLKILKTRDLFLIQAQCPFKIDRSLEQADDYVFPDNQLLLKTKPQSLKTVKSIYRQNDTMVLRFAPQQLSFLNTAGNDQSAYEVNSNQLQEGQKCQFATYISREESQMASHFQIHLAYKHLQGLMKIAEQVEGQIAMAMETIADDQAVMFMFTKGRDSQYTIGVSSARFENLDKDQQSVQASTNNLQRLKKQHDQSTVDQTMKLESQKVSVVKQSPMSTAHLQSAVPTIQKTQMALKTQNTRRTIDEESKDEQVPNTSAQKPAHQSPDQQVEEPKAQASLDEATRERQIKREEFYKEVDDEDFF